jgi:type VI secretion system protein ImpH
LAQSPEEHHVFQALRLIEAAHPDRPRLGESRRPREDPVRLGQEAELAFPTSSIASYTPGSGKRPARLVNRFFGLFGPHGPLPLHLTEYARDRYRNHRDRTFVAFVDMLTHRMMSLFYRAWAVGQPAPSFDRDDDPMARKVAAISGYHADSLLGRDALPDLARLYYSGFYAQSSRSPEGLVAIVQSFFDVPVEIEEFIGSWLVLEPDDRWQLGKGGGLGQSSNLGEKVWTRADKFRLRIGPVGREQYERLLPGGESLDRLRAAVRNYMGDALDWDVNLILKGDEVPRAALDGTTRLGMTSWLLSRKDWDDYDEDRPDVTDLYLHTGITAEQAQSGQTAHILGR